MDDYRKECGITEPIEMVEDNAARWRRVTEEAVSPQRERVSDAPSERSSRSVERRPDTRIPSLRELELRRELEDLRAQLDRG